MTVTDCEVLGGDGGPGIPNQLDRCPLQAYAVESMLKPTIVTRVVPLQRNLAQPCQPHVHLAHDTISRTLIAPAELPVGVITALLGGPFFLWMLLRGLPEGRTAGP